MDEFQSIVWELTDLFRDLTGIEQLKLRAATTQQVAMLEECMTKEQALILKLRGLERNLQKAQGTMGLGGLQFREILGRVSEEEREELIPLFEELSREVQMFQEVSEDVNIAVDANLREIEQVLQVRTGNTYGDGGKPDRTRQSHFSNRKI